MKEPSVFERVVRRPGDRLFRVARPGRATCGSSGRVPREVVEEWVQAVAANLADSNDGIPQVDYVCLLGRKRDGKSEIAGFYDVETAEDAGVGQSFEVLLNQLGAARIQFRLHHFPTTDHEELPAGTANAVIARLEALLGEGRTVLVGCSAAQGRTMDVLRRWKR